MNLSYRITEDGEYLMRPTCYDTAVTSMRFMLNRGRDVAMTIGFGDWTAFFSWMNERNLPLGYMQLIRDEAQNGGTEFEDGTGGIWQISGDTRGGVATFVS